MSQDVATAHAPTDSGDGAHSTAATDAELIAGLRAENAELRSSLLKWRVAAVAKWAETAAEAMESTSELKELKRQLHESELDRLEIGERHHQLNQLHHQLNERYQKLNRTENGRTRLSTITAAGAKRRITRVLSTRFDSHSG